MRLGVILILCGLLLMIIGFGAMSATYHSNDPKEEQILGTEQTTSVCQYWSLELCWRARAVSVLPARAK
jgi:hypothetical protein